MVSVIIDNYNYGRFIGDAIQSVVNQTYTDWELVVVDDGSVDESADVIEKYRKIYPDRIFSVYKGNAGQASCFNEGMKHASGEIIAFLDSDDAWKPNKLERIVQAHGISNYVGHEKEFSNGYSQIIHTEQADKRSYYLRKYGINDSYDIITSTLSLGRKLADKIFPMPEKEFRICADHYVKYLALYYDNPVFLHEKLTNYRIHGDNGFVIKKQTTGTADLELWLDYISVQYANTKLLSQDQNAETIPLKTCIRRNEFWKECGEGFEIKRGERYVLYGTGEDSDRFLKMIIELDGELAAYCDSDSSKWGKFKNTKEIWSPDVLLNNRVKYDKIIVASMFYYQQIAERLEQMGLRRGKDYYYTPIF